MSQLQLNQVSKDIIDHAEQALVPERGLPKVVDDYFVQRLKQDEIQHADVDSRLYEGLRNTVKIEVLPLYEQYRQETARVRQKGAENIQERVAVPACQFLRQAHALPDKPAGPVYKVVERRNRPRIGVP